MAITVAGMGFHGKGEPDCLSEYYPAKVLRRMPSFIRTGLAAATKALKNADRFPCPGDMSLIIGTHYGCQETSLDFMDSIIMDGVSLASPLAFSHSVNNVGAGLIGLCLGLHGSAITINNQADSFAAAVQCAYAQIIAGRSRMVLTGCMEDEDSRMLKVFPDLSLRASSYFILLEADDS